MSSSVHNFIGLMIVRQMGVLSITAKTLTRNKEWKYNVRECRRSMLSDKHNHSKARYYIKPVG